MDGKASEWHWLERKATAIKRLYKKKSHPKGWLGVELPWDTNPDCLLIIGEEDGLVAEIKRL